VRSITRRNDCGTDPDPAWSEGCRVRVAVAAALWLMVGDRPPTGPLKAGFSIRKPRESCTAAAAIRELWDERMCYVHQKVDRSAMRDDEGVAYVKQSSTGESTVCRGSGPAPQHVLHLAAE
jgi:hypothetical protein